MKMRTLAMLAVVAGTGFCSPVFAQDAAPASDWKVAYNFGAQSDYVFRGISQTNERPSGFAGIDVTYASRLYAGAWTSNVDFTPSGDTSTRQEYDLYGGWRPSVAGIDFDLGYIYYGYRDQPQGLRESYSEFYLKGSHAFGPLTLGAAGYASPNFPGITHEARYYEINLAYALNAQWSLSGAVGRQFESDAVQRDDGSRGDFNYSTWNAGVSYAVNEHVSVDLRYWDTNMHVAGKIYDARAVLALKATF